MACADRHDVVWQVRNVLWLVVVPIRADSQRALQRPCPVPASLGWEPSGGARREMGGTKAETAASACTTDPCPAHLLAEAPGQDSGGPMSE